MQFHTKNDDEDALWFRGLHTYNILLELQANLVIDVLDSGTKRLHLVYWKIT